MLPNVMHVPNNLALELLPGMTFTIEPIFIEAGNRSEQFCSMCILYDLSCKL